MAGVDDDLRALSSVIGSTAKGRVTFATGPVTAVTAGGSSDGRALVSVNVYGTVLAAPYDLAYTSPAVGDTVAVLVVNSVPFILGRIGGFPPV